MLKRTALVVTLSASVGWLCLQTQVDVREGLPPPASQTRHWSVIRGCPDALADAYYFPIGTFSPLAGTPSSEDDVRRRWYAKHLRALEQASLICGPAPATAYRFTYLRSFHRPIVVQVDVSQDRQRWLSAWEANGAGGYEPGEVIRRLRRLLAPQEWADLQRRLAAADVCTLDASKASNAHDGASWVVEVKERGSYCAVARQSPKDATLRALGLFFIEASGFVERSEEVY